MFRHVRNFLLASLFTLCLTPVLLAHITPMVHLVKHNEAIKSILPGAESYYVKKVQIGKEDRASVEAAIAGELHDDAYKFYYGKDAQGHVVGDVLFVNVYTRHGPLTLAVGFAPGDSIIKVVVTDVPVEPLPWVRKLLQENFLEQFSGKGSLETKEVLEFLAKEKIGKMPSYYARKITEGVKQALTLQKMLFLAKKSEKATEQP